MWMSYKQSCLIIFNCINIILKSLLDYIYSCHGKMSLILYMEQCFGGHRQCFRSVEQDILQGVYSLHHSLRADVIWDVGR